MANSGLPMRYLGSKGEDEGEQVKQSSACELADGKQNCGCVFFSVCLKTPIKGDKDIEAVITDH